MIVANLSMLVNRLLKKVFMVWIQVYMLASAWDLIIISPTFLATVLDILRKAVM
jgi:hypothetical protein